VICLLKRHLNYDQAERLSPARNAVTLGNAASVHVGGTFGAQWQAPPGNQAK